MVSAWGGAVEYQKSGAPHFHGNVHIVSVYEKHSLVEIAALIEQAALDPATVIEYQEYIHRCLHFDESGHAAEQEALEAAWRDNYADPAHDRLGWWPGFLKSEDMKTTYAAAGTEEEEKKWKKEGKAFVESFQREAQYVHSRCQHHVHRMDPVSGQKRPLSTCTSRRCKDECKHGFPAEKQVTARCKVICQGNARKHGYRVRGRRSQLGCILAKRKNPWLSGTAPVFALVFRCNTYTGPNFRLPLVEQTHDKTCRKDCVARDASRVARAMGRAAVRATNYFTGYIQKGQPVAKRTLARAAENLHFLESAIKDESAQKQLQRVATRLVSDLQFKGMVRPAAEEFRRAAHANDRDTLAGEFLRTFTCVPFDGQP